MHSYTNRRKLGWGRCWTIGQIAWRSPLVIYATSGSLPFVCFFQNGSFRILEVFISSTFSFAVNCKYSPITFLPTCSDSKPRSPSWTMGRHKTSPRPVTSAVKSSHQIYSEPVQVDVTLREPFLAVPARILQVFELTSSISSISSTPLIFNDIPPTRFPVNVVVLAVPGLSIKK